MSDESVRDEDNSGIDFEPAVPATGRERESARPRATKTPGRWRRRAGAAAVLSVGLLGMGGIYSALASSSGADSSSADQIAEGRQLYQTSCISCHGANLQGVTDRGPSLIAVGGASVYFQVSTGRMPAGQQGAGMSRHQPKFTDEQTQALAAYVQSMGGGPMLPGGQLRDADVAAGGNLFRLNCASCHGTTFKGAPLSAGKSAPSLNEATDKQIYAAMLTGPESMPIFGDNQLTPEQKKQIITYIQTMKASADPGGNGIDRIGPASEAIVIWVVGVGALMVAILWIGAKTQ